MRRFSERQGLVPIREALQVESMDAALRNHLWDVLGTHVWDRVNRLSRVNEEVWVREFQLRLWHHYFKKPYDEAPERVSQFMKELREYYFGCSWYEVYDFVEYVASELEGHSREAFIELANVILERGLSAYRFVGGMLTRLTSEDEIAAVESALSLPEPLKPAILHFRTALSLLSDRSNPDYRNSIKESISAVESTCKLIAGTGDTLTKALKALDIKLPLHRSLRESFQHLYWYTSDANGIRHALMDEPDLDFDDAKFMLVSCSAFVNYIVAKATKAGIPLSPGSAAANAQTPSP